MNLGIERRNEIMAANVETMFSVREKPWHGLGTIVAEAPASAEALKLAGLDWKVVQAPIYTGRGEEVAGYKANLRDTDRQVLGVVTDRYAGWNQLKNLTISQDFYLR
jgi:hypothetical protein